MRRSVGPRLLVSAGIAVALVAVSPPFDGAADTTLAVHMTQHVLLVDVAAVLLGAGIVMRRTPTIAATVLIGAISTATLWGWHAPVLYEAAIHHTPLHALEHVTLFATATAMWWAVVRAPRAGVVVIFVTLLPATVLGALMTVSQATWYPTYRDLADQQLAGVIMWGFGGLATIAVGVALFASLLTRARMGEPA